MLSTSRASRLSSRTVGLKLTTQGLPVAARPVVSLAPRQTPLARRALHVGARRPQRFPLAQPASASTLAKQSTTQRRFASSNGKVNLEDIRNISAWGHIDAGKTTLTERLLYHTGGMTSSPEQLDAARNAALPGDVDDGSTVTDFLEQERERGITIQSAAVGPLWWTPQRDPVDADSSTSVKTPKRGAITLIDTPGHIDFTIEVERALRVADGCIVVMDSVEGVEAQTEMNWSIGKRYGVKSNLLFLNKLDRQGASVAKGIKSFISRGLHPRPALIQLPLLPESSQGTELEGGIAGIVDLINRQVIRFEGRAGEDMEKSPIEEHNDASLRAEVVKARMALVETVASLDETLMEELLGLDTPDEPHHHISATALKAAIRRQTIRGNIVPALMGSAAKNIGIQPLLDAVVDFLPAPEDAGDVLDQQGDGVGTVLALSEQSRHRKGAYRTQTSPSASAPSKAATEKKNLAAPATDGPLATTQEGEHAPGQQIAINVKDKDMTALAFKVVWDKRRGPMTFVRVYSGVLSKSTSLLNTTTNTRERLNRLLLPFGSTYTEVDQLRGGQVGVILGLRDTRTGDTLVDNRAKSIDSTLRLRRVEIPPPVFSVSVEPHSKSDEASVNEALSMLVRTDPSLRIDNGFDDHGGGTAFGAAGNNQTILSGMGELHLEIAKDRLKNEFGVKARIGGVRVSYRETINAKSDRNGWYIVDDVMEKDMGGKQVRVGARIAIRTLEDQSLSDSNLGDNAVQISLGQDEEARGNYEARAEGRREERAKEQRSGPADSNRSGAARDADPIGVSVLSDLDADGVRRSVLSGVTAAISRGPLSSHPLTKLEIRVSNVRTFSPEESPPQAISMITNALVREAVRQAGARMMEPVMRVRIGTEEGFLGRVVGDVTSEQAGEIVDVEHEQAAAEGGDAQGSEDLRNIQVYVPEDSGAGGASSTSGLDSGLASPGPGPRQKTTIVALIPLARLTSYSSRLRALTAGGGTYTMQLEGFKTVSDERQSEILSELGRV